MFNIVTSLLKRKPEVSIIVLSLNRKDDLHRCVESIKKTVNFPSEVIIWDNGSNQETLEYLSNARKNLTHKFITLNVVLHKTNIGCSNGRKRAAKLARSDLLYFLDNDGELKDGWFFPLREIITDRHVAAVCSKILFPNNLIQMNGGDLKIEDNYFATFSERDAGKCWDDPTTTLPRETEWVPGGATLFKKSIFNHLDVDESYFNGFEDYDISLQLRKRGYKLYSCPQSVMVHHHIMLNLLQRIKEPEYLCQRWNSSSIWKSMITFHKRTGLNVVRSSPFAAQYKNKTKEEIMRQFSDYVITI